ncbi:response regulator receiver protein [Chondrocystis sp. NIES-4102]|nr:response regulator receiver protein [Chondrocystis sp. NIES-4102]
MCKSILVVEDNDDLLLLFRLVLESAGYQVATVNNGQDALNVLGKLRPKLILMDVMMPKISGLEVARRIKEQLRFHSLPILLVSGIDQIQEEQLVDSRADGILYKPFDLDDLTSRVKSLISKSYTNSDSDCYIPQNQPIHSYNAPKLKSRTFK